MVVIVVVPLALRGIFPEAVPDVVMVPFIVMVALASVVMAVCFTEVINGSTEVVYVVIVPTVPVLVSKAAGLMLMPLRVAILEPFLLMMIL